MGGFNGQSIFSLFLSKWISGIQHYTQHSTTSCSVVSAETCHKLGLAANWLFGGSARRSTGRRSRRPNRTAEPPPNPPARRFLPASKWKLT